MELKGAGMLMAARRIGSGACRLSYAFLWLGSAACGVADDEGAGNFPADDGFSQVDSAGITISVTSGVAARTPLHWELDSVPSLQLGENGDEAQIFYQIAGVRQLPDGRVLVLDGGSRELRFFDDSGVLGERVGRQGEGPNEFETPRLVPAPASDSVLVWDVRLRRTHRYVAGRAEPEIVRPASWVGGRPPLGIAGEKALVSYSAEPIRSDQLGSPMPQLFAWIDIRSGQRVVLDTLVLDNLIRIDRGAGAVPLMVGRPFTSAPSGVVVGSRAWIFDGAIWEIRVYDVTGRLHGIVRIDEARRPPTEEALNDYVSALANGNEERRRALQETYSGVPLPDSMAVFESLVVDDLGLVWAELYEPGSKPTRDWMIFDEDGRALGVFATPRALHVHQIGQDFMLGIETDELGVERVRKYLLRRQ